MMETGKESLVNMKRAMTVRNVRLFAATAAVSIAAGVMTAIGAVTGAGSASAVLPPAPIACDDNGRSLICVWSRREDCLNDMNAKFASGRFRNSAYASDQCRWVPANEFHPWNNPPGFGYGILHN